MMTRTDSVLLGSTGNVIDPSTGQPTGQVSIDIGELITYDVNDATDHGTYWIISSGARAVYPAQSGQIVDTLEPVHVGDLSDDGPDSTPLPL